jgi:ribosomal protein S17E
MDKTLIETTEKSFTLIFEKAKKFVESDKNLKRELKKIEDENLKSSFILASYKNEEFSSLRWAAYFIKNNLEKDFFEVTVAGEKESFTLYAPQLEQFKHYNIYISLLYFNGQFWQTHYDIHPFKNLELIDVAQFAITVNSTSFKSDNFTTFVQKNFEQFFLIDLLKEAERAYYKNILMEKYFASFKVNDFDREKLLGNWTKYESKNGKFIAYYLDSIDEDNDFLNETFYNENGTTKEEFWQEDNNQERLLYYNKQNKELTLVANNKANYEILTLLLKASFNYTNLEAQWVLPFPLYNLICNRKTLKAPWKEIEEAFHPYKERALFNLIDDLKNSKTIDFKYLASFYNLEEEFVTSFYEQFEPVIQLSLRSDNLTASDKEYLLKITPPLFYEQEHLEARLTEDDSLFELTDKIYIYSDFNTLTNNSFKNEINNTTDLAIWINDLFEKEFGSQIGTKVMNIFLYYLLNTLDDLTSVRSFALEIHLLLQEELKLPQNEFISKLSHFILKRLCPLFVCEVTKRPTKEELTEGLYQIRTTPFFARFINFKDEE